MILLRPHSAGRQLFQKGFAPLGRVPGVLALRGGSLVRNCCSCAVLALLLAVQALSAPAKEEEFTFKIPPQKISLNIDNQPIAIIASGIISVTARGHDGYLRAKAFHAKAQRC